MSLTMSYRGLSIGAWLMLLGLTVGGLATAIAAVIIGATGANPFEGPPSIDRVPDTQNLLMSLFLVASLLVALLAGLLIVIGLALYVAIPSLSPETAREGYGSHRTILACLILAVIASTALQLVYIVAGNVQIDPESLSPSTLLVVLLSLQFSLLLIVWIRIIRPRVISWAEMGLTKDRLGHRALVGLGTGVAVVIAAAIVEQVLSRLGVEQTQMNVFAPIKNATPPQFVALLLAGAGFVPFVEEVVFRGYVFKAYLEQKGVIQAYVFGPLVFALPHMTELEARALGIVPPAFISGLILAYVFRRTGSIIPTIVGHAMNNFIAFTAIYLGLS